MAEELPWYTWMRQTLVERLSDDEIRNICFDLQIDPENFEANAKTGRVRSLLEHCQRHQRAEDLLAVCRRQRPDIAWRPLDPPEAPPPRAEASPAAQPPAADAPAARSRTFSFRLTGALVAFLVGVLGNLLAAWIQQSLFGDVFTWPRVLGVVLLAAIGLAAGVWIEYLRPPGKLRVLVAGAAALVIALVALTLLPVGASVSAKTFLQPTTVVVASFDGCPERSSELSRELRNLVSSRSPSIRVEHRAAQVSREQARRLEADLVIWGGCDGSVLTSSFELLSSRGAPELYEPQSVSLREPAGGPWTQHLAYALSLYLHRDYGGAAGSLSSVSTTLPGAELQLLEGNSLMYAGRYEEAGQAFALAAKDGAFQARAWNNQGLAEANERWRAGEFELATETLARATGRDPSLEIARINLGRVQIQSAAIIANERSAALFTGAEELCRKGTTAREARARTLAAICLVELYWSRRAQGIAQDALQFDDRLLQEPPPYWSAPLLARGVRDYMLFADSHSDGLARDRAREALTAYLEAVTQDVPLARAQQDRELAEILLGQLGPP